MDVVDLARAAGIAGFVRARETAEPGSAAAVTKQYDPVVLARMVGLPGFDTEGPNNDAAAVDFEGVSDPIALARSVGLKAFADVTPTHADKSDSLSAVNSTDVVELARAAGMTGFGSSAPTPTSSLPSNGEQSSLQWDDPVALAYGVGLAGFTAPAIEQQSVTTKAAISAVSRQRSEILLSNVGSGATIVRNPVVTTTTMVADRRGSPQRVPTNAANSRYVISVQMFGREGRLALEDAITDESERALILSGDHVYAPRGAGIAFARFCPPSMKAVESIHSHTRLSEWPICFTAPLRSNSPQLKNRELPVLKQSSIDALLKHLAR